MNFDVTKIELSGKNLIEASAGTGKTFSVAILTLRLILEKQVNVNEVLMVTFTEAATAELSERVGSFINQAYRSVLGEKVEESMIGDLVADAMEIQGKEAVLETLSAARLLRDELNVFTIHAFCSQVLKQEAFATGQLFNSEITGDEKQFLIEGLKEYWREHVATLSTELLTWLSEETDFSFSDALKVCSKYAERIYFGSHEHFNDDFDLNASSPKGLEVKVEKERLTFISEPLEAYFKAEKESTTLKAVAHKNTIAKAESTLDLVNVLQAILTKKAPPKYLAEFPQAILDEVSRVFSIINAVPDASVKIMSTIYHRAAMFSLDFSKRIKARRGMQTYNDMIFNLYDVIGKNSGLELDSRYKAVFIDEFQDTDPYQSKIFESLFDAEKTTVFYVGDPKQSIYSFRGADLDSYNGIQKEQTFSMGINYRSSPNYIEAMNTFFNAKEGFFKDENIEYTKVDSIKSSTDVVNSAALEVHNVGAVPEVFDQIQLIVLDLLHGEHRIGKEQRKVKPQDIAILTRSNGDAVKVQEALSSIRVPAVVLSDRSIFNSEENATLRLILQALLDARVTSIKTILSTNLIDLSAAELKDLDSSVLLEDFDLIQEEYKTKGVYAALTLFLEVFKVKANLIQKSPADKDRVVSNYKQLAELCNKREREESASLEDLIQWLLLKSREKETEGYEQRIESDSDAVQILTIHKSKGLEYNIVISGSLLMKPKKSKEYTYKDDSETRLLSLNASCVAQSGLDQINQDKENSRLVYVALTRAKYKFILLTTKRGLAGTVVGDYLKGLAAYPNEHIVLDATVPESKIAYYSPEKEELVKKESLVSTRTSFKPDVYISSYSSLAVHEGHHQYPRREEQQEAYDSFIFKNMPRGASIGNFLHYLFENIEFSNPQTDRLLKRAQRRFGSHLIQDEHLPFYEELINHTLQADLPGLDVNLGQLDDNKILAELEFYVTEEELSEASVAASFDKPVKLNQGKFEGLIKGFIDLVFEHDGKYYILDWKSNFIGDSIEDYTFEKLDVAMSNSNYHLQYYIYAKALKKYLQLLHPDFDPTVYFGGVYYVFLRGCRAGESSGVFHYNKNLVKV